MVAVVDGGGLDSVPADAAALPVKLGGLDDQEECLDLECYGGTVPNAYDALLAAQPAAQTPVHRFLVVRRPSFSLPGPRPWRGAHPPRARRAGTTTC